MKVNCERCAGLGVVVYVFDGVMPCPKCKGKGVKYKYNKKGKK